jgi:hypothetical protein
MAMTEIAIALKFIALNTANPELKKITDSLANMGLAAKAAQVSFSAFKNVSSYMAGAAKEASGNNQVLSKGLLFGGSALALGGLLGKFGVLKGLLGQGTKVGNLAAGMSGKAGGILEGKVYEKMGVAPVFVVNMPKEGIPGAPAS